MSVKINFNLIENINLDFNPTNTSIFNQGISNNRYSITPFNYTNKVIDISNFDNTINDNILRGYTLDKIYSSNVRYIVKNVGVNDYNNIDNLKNIILNAYNQDLKSNYINLLYFISSIQYNNFNENYISIIGRNRNIRDQYIYFNNSPKFIKINNTIGNQYYNIYDISIYKWNIDTIQDFDYIYKCISKEYIFNQNVRIFFVRSAFINNLEFNSIKSTIDNVIGNNFYFKEVYSPGGFLVQINGEEYIIQLNTIGSLYNYNIILSILEYFKTILPEVIFNYYPITIFEYHRYNSNTSYTWNFTGQNLISYYSDNIYLLNFLYKKYYNVDKTTTSIKHFNVISQQIPNLENNILSIINPISKEEEHYNLLDSTFINNIGNGGDYYYLNLVGFDLSTSNPIQLCIGKEYQIGQTKFQDIKYLIGGNRCINNDEIIYKKNYLYDTLFSITIVNPPLSNSSYNYGRNFIEVHKYIYNLSYNWNNQFITSGTNRIIEYKNFKIPTILYSNNIIFDIELSIKLFNTNNLSDLTNLFNEYLYSTSKINNSYISQLGIRYPNEMSSIDDYKYNIYKNNNNISLYISLISLYKNMNILNNEMYLFFNSNFYKSFYNIFKNSIRTRINYVDLSNSETDINLNILNIVNPDYTVYIPSEHEIRLFMDGTNLFANKDNYIYLSYGQKQNDVNTLFEFNTDMIYLKFKDDTNSYSFVEAMDKILSDRTTNEIYMMITIPSYLMKDKMKFYLFYLQSFLIKNFYLYHTKYNNSSFMNIINLYFNKYLIRNNFIILYKYVKSNNSIEIIYPYKADTRISIFDDLTANISGYFYVNKNIIFNSKYQFIPDDQGRDFYILNSNKANLIMNIVNNNYNVGYPIYYCDYGLFGYDFLQRDINKRKINVIEVK